MKNTHKLINICLIIIFVFSIISFALLVNPCDHTFNDYIELKRLADVMSDDQSAQSIALLYQQLFLQTLFSIIFSALSTIASTATFVLLNFKVWKEKKD